jgi:hypothetical protein
VEAYIPYAASETEVTNEDTPVPGR